MAGNGFSDNSGNIFVEEAYNNIILVDPNKTSRTSTNGQKIIEERLVDHENLVMFANLEVDLLPRTKLAVGGTPQDNIRTISIAKINFLKPNNDQFLNSGYYDDLTGLGAINGQARLQRNETVVTNQDGTNFYKQSITTDERGMTIDPGLLGITSINVRTSLNFIPEVTIELEDVQGRALFEQGDQSPYAAFFQLPYPQFYLTLKGWYGQAIRYQLNLHKFNARFNTFSGNYQVTCQFFGYKYNILNEITLGHLTALPNMYTSTFNINRTPIDSQQNDTTTRSQLNSQLANSTDANNSEYSISETVVSQRGYQKIREVYGEYKSKGLIPLDFPELTLPELGYRLKNFQEKIVASYTKVDLQPLTDAETYRKTLKEYYNKVRGDSDSWYTKYLNNKPYILSNTGQEVYAFKTELSPERRTQALSELTAITQIYNSRLADNATYGKSASKNFKITNSINKDTFYIQLDPSLIDWVQTTTFQTGIVGPTPQQVADFLKQQYQRLFFITLEITPDGLKEVKQPFFSFIGPQRFDNIIRAMEGDLDNIVNQEENRITEELSTKIVSTDTGIGFRPTVRNVTAVIMASTEAFIRLMDDVHEKAWQVKTDPVRKDFIFRNDTSVPNSDGVDRVQYAANADAAAVQDSEVFVYPWPQVFVENDDPNKNKYELAYPGDPSIVNLTKGYLYDKWPEVEFVEEYLKGTAQRLTGVNQRPPQQNDAQVTSRLNLNAIEFPFVNFAYRNTEEIRFFYEIFERQFMYSYYTGFGRLINSPIKTSLISTIGVLEAGNIISSLGISNPYLINKLKNTILSSANYQATLESFSNQGTGAFWQEFIRDIFVTEYLRREVQNNFSILSTDTLSSLVLAPDTNLPGEDTVKELLASTITNQVQFIDTYPFTNEVWNATNLSGYITVGNVASANDTRRTYKIFEPKNLIANFTEVNNITINRPVTSFNYLSTTTPNPINNLSAFYVARTADNLLPTEGFIRTNTESLPFEKTTSMLNTPYFVNSILVGVQNEKNKVENPYVAASYLLINSLPLSTFREKYKSYENNVTVSLDYIFASFKKFGAIHKVPYVWVLKYGSIWHRYKTYIESGINQTDILSPVWSNFNYVNNYDPVTNNTQKTYNLSVGDIQLQSQFNQLAVQYTNLSVGFYPKAINDFNYFLNGNDLYTNYTDSEINQSIRDGLKIQNLANSNIQTNALTNAGQVSVLNMTTYSCIIPDGIPTTDPNLSVCDDTPSTPQVNYYILPSFGTELNEVRESCFTIQGVQTQDLYNNSSVFNGSVRLFWKLPNYGFFDSNDIVRPAYDEYLNLVPLLGTVPAFDLKNAAQVLTSPYSKIDDMFSVFERSVLDKLEDEFLKFSQSVSNYKNDTSVDPLAVLDPTVNTADRTVGQSNQDINVQYKNFQSLMRELLSVPLPPVYSDEEDLFVKIIDNQYGSFVSKIQNLMGYDVALRMGNPTVYRRRIVDSYISYVTGNLTVADPIPFSPYVQGSLPDGGGTTTFLTSRLVNQNAWRGLDLSVGFSTIPELNYVGNSSYITDFFISSNIQFNEFNTTELSQLIKLYATQKLDNPNLTAQDFAGQLQSYLTTYQEFFDQSLNQTIILTQKGLPEISQLPEGRIQSQYDGSQPKVELYEVFKALNDKWIAGSNFKESSLFEDIMFLDRASRDIGQKILIDIFDLERITDSDSINYNMSVFVFLAGILTKNHFSVMPLPAYVNFYNQTQDVAGNNANDVDQTPQDFANDMWGTFLNVDYRNSGPKLICFYSGRPSSYLDMKGNKNFLFRSDAFDIRSNNNPLVRQEDNVNTLFNNKVVGFNVDIGTRNQNIFYSFRVDQNMGKATSESIQQINQMSDFASGRNTATQNVSLYNIYKNMSYNCEVVSFGNALIQPTMYFNLRHVPMFNGSYMITDVNHTVTPGSFQTQFTGIRQSVFDLPLIDNYLMSVNKNLVSKVISAVKQRKDDVSVTTTTQQKNANKSTNPNTTTAEQNSCTAKVKEYPYLDVLGFQSVSGTDTKLNAEQLYNEIKLVTPDQNLQFVIFAICYVSSFSDNRFNGYDNNYGKITLEYNYSDLVEKYFLRTYSCRNFTTNQNSKVSNPVAMFATTNDFLQFMRDRLRDKIGQIRQKSLETFYLQNYPYPTGVSQTRNPEVQALLLKAKVLMDKLQGQETPPFKSNIPLIPTPAPSPVVNNLNTTNQIVPTCTPTPSNAVFQFGVGPNTGNPVPTPTPSATIVIPQSTDDTILNNNAILGTTNLSIRYGSPSGTLTGTFTITGQLSQSYPARIYVAQTGTVGAMTIANFTLIPSQVVSSGQYTSTTDGWRTVLSRLVGNQPNYSVVIRVSVTTPAKEHIFTFVRSVIPLECPALGFETDEIISVQDMQTILQDPCCECYPTGTNGFKIILYGTTCDLTGSNC